MVPTTTIKLNSSVPCSIKSVLAHTVIPKEAHQQGKSVSILQCTVQLSVQPHCPDTIVIMGWKWRGCPLAWHRAPPKWNIKKDEETTLGLTPIPVHFLLYHTGFSLLSQVPQEKELKTGPDNINSSKSHIHGPSNSGSKLTPEICPKQGNVFPCQYSLNNTVLTTAYIMY